MFTKKKESQCEESRRQHGKTGALNGFEKTNTSLAGERKETNKTQTCANGPPQRQRALSAQMTR